MARILFNGNWFEEISPSSFYETDFENLVFRQAEILYPDYQLVPFKLTVTSEFGSAKPDFALIDRAYRNWWVGEIEIASHPFETHVLPQVEVLSNANYGEREARYLFNACPTLDLNNLFVMMKGHQPRVIVVVNTPCPAWINAINKHNAILEIFEIFRSCDNRYIFRINGQHPPQLVEIKSECEFDKILPRLLKINSPAILKVKANEKMKVKYLEGFSEWERIDSLDTVWLSPININPLNPKDKYELRLLENGIYEIYCITKRRGQ